MGGESNNAVAYNSYHQMFSGRSARLVGVTDLPFEVKRSEESIANSAGVQLLKTVDGSIVVWGVRAPSISQSFSMIHTRRIQSYMTRIFLEMPQLQDLMFRPNNEQLVAQFRMILVATIKKIWKTGAFNKSIPFEQAVNITNNPGTDDESSFSSNATMEVLNGVLSANVLWSPTGIAEKIQLNIGTTQM
jgi:phage tail sheath protein FI